MKYKDQFKMNFENIWLFRWAVAVVVIMIQQFAIGQIHYSHHFTSKLKNVGGSFIEPVEGYYKVKMLKRDDFMPYDLVINSEEKEFEMRFMLDADPIVVPKIAALNLASNLASNDPHFDVKFQIFTESNAKNYYGAAWAAYADFVPKARLSDKHFARLLCIYHPEKGMISQLMLFNRHDDEKDRRLYSIAFESDAPLDKVTGQIVH